MSLYYCWVTKMANAVVLWVLVYFCVTSVNTKDTYNKIYCDSFEIGRLLSLWEDNENLKHFFNVSRLQCRTWKTLLMSFNQLSKYYVK